MIRDVPGIMCELFVSSTRNSPCDWEMSFQDEAVVRAHPRLQLAFQISRAILQAEPTDISIVRRKFCHIIFAVKPLCTSPSELICTTQYNPAKGSNCMTILTSFFLDPPMCHDGNRICLIVRNTHRGKTSIQLPKRTNQKTVCAPSKLWTFPPTSSRRFRAQSDSLRLLCDQAVILPLRAVVCYAMSVTLGSFRTRLPCAYSSFTLMLI